MATQHRSTILGEIDFKIRCIAHFKKVHDKATDLKLQQQMLDQTVRANRVIVDMIGSDKKLSLAARKLRDTHKLKQFISTALGASNG